MRRLSLVARFGILSFFCVVALALAMNFALSHLLTRAVSEWEWENTAASVQHEVQLAGLDDLFVAPHPSEARQRWERELSRLFVGVPEVVRVKVWDREATVLWSDKAELIGRRFPENGRLRKALGGKVTVEIKKLSQSEHLYESAHFPVLAEVYVPIFSRQTREVIGVIEVYKAPNRLYATIRWSRIVIWAISLSGGLVLYLTLLPIFRQVYRVREEAHRAYAERLEQDVAERTRELQRQSKEIERAYEELRQTQDQLVQSEKLRALGEMAAGVAHDFNNLLAAILGRAQFVLLRLAEGEVPPAEVRRNLAVIERAARDGAETVRRLLDFTRITPRQQETEAVSVADLLASVIAASQPRWKDEAGAKGAQIEVVQELGSAPPVVGNPAELREVFLNLVFNAIDAMPQGGSLTLASWAENGDVCVAVKDTGVGISEGARSKIFDPFFTTKGPQSSGLGLSVSYGIVRRHGGEITVESRQGQGTTFTVRLPVPKAPPPRPEAVSKPARPGLRVLVIDDEESVREILRDLLEAAGQEVWEASSGSEGLGILERQPMDLVFTDLGMSGMTGWEVAERIRARWPGLKVALITGWGARVEPEELRAHGVDFLLAKPFQMKDLLDVLAAAPRTTAADRTASRS